MNSRETASSVQAALLAVVLALVACGSSVPAPPAMAVPTATPSPIPTPTITLMLSARVAIREYAEQCAAIQENTPLSLLAHGTRNEFLDYLSDEWSRLVPPPSLEAYHAAVQATYDEWRTLPEDVDPDPNSPVMRRALDLTFKLDKYTLDMLEAKRCINRGASNDAP